VVVPPVDPVVPEGAADVVVVGGVVVVVDLGAWGWLGCVVAGPEGIVSFT
jgi:hypothetical protein